MVVGVGLRLPDSKPLGETDGVQPAVARPGVAPTTTTTEPVSRLILAQGTSPSSDLGALEAPRVGPLAAPGQGLPLNLQNDLRRAYERMGADPGTRDALVGRLAALPWGNTLSFDRNDPQAVLAALPRIHDILKAGFNVTSGDAPITLAEVAKEGRANCFGSSQVFLGLADAIGLNARSIQVAEATSGTGTLHVASMVDLPDGRQVTVDMLYPDAVSRPFRQDAIYRRDGNVLRLNDAERGNHYAAIRPLSREQLRTFVDSQSPTRDTNASRADQSAAELAFTRAALAADPDNPWLHVTLAENLENGRPGRFADETPPGDLPNLREQEGALRRAMALSPTFDDLYTKLGRIQDKLGEYAAATSTRRHALELFENDFVPRLRAAANLGADAPLSALLAAPAASTDDFRGDVEKLIAWRVETGVSMGRSGDRAGARAYLEETRRLASVATGTNWFDYYSGQSYIDQFQGP